MNITIGLAILIAIILNYYEQTLILYLLIIVVILISGISAVLLNDS